jgi:exopolyphosphatase/guanosine-5'-triphosphate,3'-diphosphate pyrophosphatase
MKSAAMRRTEAGEAQEQRVEDRRPEPEQVAAVDLGSNSFHMIVARAAPGELVVLDRLREMVRLAAGLDRSRRLSAEAQARALTCLERFGQRVRHLPRRAVRAVGTNTLRSAHNAAEFVSRAEEALGHPIDTISGIEEARLIYLGVSRSLPDRGVRRLVLDIGGGSTEVIIGESERTLALDSLYLGCVSMSREHFAKGNLDEASWRRGELAALREFEPIRARFRKLGWEEAIGSSGTIRAVEGVVRAEGWGDRGITIEALRKLRGAILEAKHLKNLELDGLSSQRRPVFVGGVVALLAAFETLGIEVMEVSDGALREGLLYDLLGRIQQADVREETVNALGERYHVDWAHARLVEATALALLEQVGEDWDVGDEESRRFLAWGARLHEVGLDVAHAQYHKHGEYIVAQSDLPGFSRDEQRLLATLVRGHRRKFPASVVKELPKERRLRIERLCVLLRLATILHRSRAPDPSPRPEVAARDGAVHLVFPARWLSQHPLTHDDLRQEQAFLKAAGHRLQFE